MAAKVSVSLCVEGGHIQVLQMRKDKKGLSVEKVIVENIPKSYNLEEKAVVIKDVWQTNKMLYKQVSLLIPRYLWSSKIIPIPTTNLDTVKQVMDVNIEQYLPFSMSQAVWDWQILRQGPGEESTVMLMAIKREDFEERLKILKLAGLKLASIEVSTMGLLNTFSYFLPDIEKECVAFVDLQVGWVDILVVDHSYLASSRGIEVPKGITAIPTWVGEVKHTIMAYNQNNPHRKIDRLFVSASSSLINFLKEKKFEEPLQRSFEVFNSDLPLTMDPQINLNMLVGPNLRQLGLAKYAFYLAKAKGAVVGTTKDTRKGIYSIPPLIRSGVAACLIIGLGSGTLHFMNKDKNQKYNDSKGDDKKKVQKTKQEEKDMLDDLMIILDARVKGIFIRNIDFSGSTIKIIGEATKRDDVHEFGKKLRQKEGFEETDIDRTDPQADNTMKYTISCKRKAKKPFVKKGDAEE